MLKAPSWWWNPRARIPFGVKTLGKIYHQVARWHQRRRSVFCEKAPVPVISVGSCLMGGSGKTPTALFLASLLQSLGKSPVLLTRGYGGRGPFPCQVHPDRHGPPDVGEEALLLARHFPTFVSPVRKHALPLLSRTPSEVIVLDDGHQHHSLVKDLSFLVMTHRQQWGNGHLFPAGPLREPLKESMVRAHGLFYLYETERPSGLDLPIPVFFLKACFQCALPFSSSVVGFAGLGYPQRFFHILKTLFSQVKACISFPDHVFYRPSHERSLQALAHTHKAQLVTTEKDWIKLSPGLKPHVAVLHQTLIPDDPQALVDFLQSKGF